MFGNPLSFECLKAGRDWLQPAVGNQGCLPLGLGVKVNGPSWVLYQQPGAAGKAVADGSTQPREHIALLAHEPESGLQGKPLRDSRNPAAVTMADHSPPEHGDAAAYFPNPLKREGTIRVGITGLLRPGQTPIIRPVAKPLAQGPSRLSSDCPAQTNRPSCPLGILAVETGAVLQCTAHLSSKTRAKGPFPAY